MKKLLYLFLTVLIVACSSEDGGIDGDNNQSSCNGDNPVYLADNGVTIKACDDAEVYSTGIINGETYTVVNEIVLRDMIENGDDITKVVTTKITDMSYLLATEYESFYDFNQDISSWDVSNVTTMEYMFAEADLFNQDISIWDVSNVISLCGMFANATSFNQPIGNWDVSNNECLAAMFQGATSFNQPIGNWDVSNTIANDVNLYPMQQIFQGATSFNQDLSNWDVSHVENMTLMFAFASSFNQDISDWDVSNTNNMYRMFTAAYAFNQDLSSWNVDNVTLCNNFSENATSWTLPQPNFTNCTP